ncbi:MAG: HVO_2922 family protein [Haloarculaceae archaeon]
MVIAGAALVLLIAGPLVRLPLRRLATILVYVGAVLSLAALPWFVVSYPGWRPQASGIVGLYSLGLAVMAIGGVFVPVLTAGAEREEELARRGEQIEELERVLEDADADGDDLSRLIDELRQSEHDLSATLDRLRAEQADTAADEADLAARLAALRQSQARFELYEDAQEQFRWRLRHRNGNILADSGQGYADRRGSWDGIESVKRNAPNADVAGA